MTFLRSARDEVSQVQPAGVTGLVGCLKGLTVLVDDLPLPVGSMVRIGESVQAEVIGFTREHSVVMPIGQMSGIRPGDRVLGLETRQRAPVGESLLGRVVNGLGVPIDGKGPVVGTRGYPIDPTPLVAMRRRRITRQLATGVRALDLMTPLGRGQRMGIFSGPGVGKSTLLGSIARHTEADVSVISLIGERGREVKDFIEHALGAEGLARSVVVVATGDESPLMRIRAAKLACACAEYFRDRGLDALLMMDSVTRFAHAQRQVGLSVGEPPATKGYTPSVFAQMGLLLERAGAVEGEEPVAGKGAGTAPTGAGSVTGLYTILVDGDDMTDPIADAARGILDGHVVLSRKLAQRAHYPAIDVLDSVSRVANDICPKDHLAARSQLIRLMALYREVEDLVQIGAYARGSSPETDVAIEYHRAIIELLRQEPGTVEPIETSRSRMVKLALQSMETYERIMKTRGRGAA